MAVVTYEVVPEEQADMMIVLTDPCVDFASWSRNVEPDSSEPSSLVPSDGYAGPEDVKYRGGEFERRSMPDDNRAINTSGGLKSGLVMKMHYPRIRRALHSTFKEATPEGNGRYHKAPEWDVEALLILLYALHHMRRKVPGNISLDTLAQIGEIADYYECGTYYRELVLWIWIAWVFNLEGEFRRATKVTIIKCNEEHIRKLGLRIRDIVTVKSIRLRYQADAIRNCRIQAIGYVLQSLYGLLEKYKVPNMSVLRLKECSLACGSILCGALLKFMVSESLYNLRPEKPSDPRPQKPFPGETISRLYRDVRNIQNPVWCANQGALDECSEHIGVGEECNLRSAVLGILVEVENYVKGLDLDSLKK
ncbi:hypothetical protein BU23DRAFT_566123 [Bimuria novae-zelandiae CBS 107.79]|uniref:BTB domain-containing protein n=1 Tax=Bimuria novae-zelandiae CBS 107.79 TaxID=1447943 RepID=A0A6A5VHL4_9PLEO|nr:hypothetical protein BU23DRAFT_566123 [Bimuria novae-zelandiae CBS 107.79]